MCRCGWSDGCTEWYSKIKPTNRRTHAPRAGHVGLVWLKQCKVTVCPLSKSKKFRHLLCSSLPPSFHATTTLSRSLPCQSRSTTRKRRVCSPGSCWRAQGVPVPVCGGTGGEFGHHGAIFRADLQRKQEVHLVLQHTPTAPLSCCDIGVLGDAQKFRSLDEKWFLLCFV